MLVVRRYPLPPPTLFTNRTDKAVKCTRTLNESCLVEVNSISGRTFLPPPPPENGVEWKHSSDWCVALEELDQRPLVIESDFDCDPILLNDDWWAFWLIWLQPRVSLKNVSPKRESNICSTAFVISSTSGSRIPQWPAQFTNEKTAWK